MVWRHSPAPVTIRVIPAQKRTGIQTMNQPPRDALCRVFDAMEHAGVSRGDLVLQGVASRNVLQRIFWRRRPLSEALLARIAGALDVPVKALQGEDRLS
jgi:hypothetical protein